MAASRILLILIAVLLPINGLVVCPVSAGSPVTKGAQLRVQRVVMLFRHGVRAPLPGEAAEALSDARWPTWSTPPSYLTPHGREAMRQLGIYDRALFASKGLLPKHGCPPPNTIEIWTNTAERTIASGEALAEGLAPECNLIVGHLGADQKDPLFEPYEAGVVSMDPSAAVTAVNIATGGASRLAKPFGKPFAALESILDCGPAPKIPTCDLVNDPGEVRVSTDGKGIDLIGPISPAGGSGEVLLMQYAEGWPLDQVGWGRAGPKQLAEVSRLHSVTFDVYARPRYLAARLAGPLARRVEQRLTARSGPKLVLMVGHDDNIAALASLAGLHFKVPGYGYDDPPMGGALGFEVLVDRHSGERYVRAFYQAQTLTQLRNVTATGDITRPWIRVLPLRACFHRTSRLCRMRDFVSLLNRKLVL